MCSKPNFDPQWAKVQNGTVKIDVFAVRKKHHGQMIAHLFTTRQQRIAKTKEAGYRSYIAIYIQICN